MTTPELDQAAMASIEDAIRQKKCILFLGAGVHVPPPNDLQQRWPYPVDQRPPLGSALSEHLAQKLDLARQHPNESLRNLGRTSLFYEVARGRRQLIDELRQAVDIGKQPSPVLQALADLQFPLVITTNYDKLLERALARAGCIPRVSIYNPDSHGPTEDLRDDPDPKQPFLFKIHGDIDKPESIVITDEDYIQFILRMGDDKVYSPLPETFHYHFVRWTTLFVGYSLLDYNLRLLFKTLRWKIDLASIPDSYSVDRFPDPLIVDVLSNRQRLVRFVVEDIWTFVPELYRRILGEEMPDHHS